MKVDKRVTTITTYENYKIMSYLERKNDKRKNDEGRMTKYVSKKIFLKKYFVYDVLKRKIYTGSTFKVAAHVTFTL